MFIRTSSASILFSAGLAATGALLCTVVTTIASLTLLTTRCYSLMFIRAGSASTSVVTSAAAFIAFLSTVVTTIASLTLLT